MIQIEFTTDGKVRVFAMQDGNTFSVSCEANKIPVLMPGIMLDELREKMSQFLELTAKPNHLKIVGAK